MADLLQIMLPFVVALGAGVLSFIVVQARMQVALAREREDLVAARTRLAQQRETVEQTIKGVEAEARRKALDEFLADIHVEERHYVREIQSATERRQSLVVQERICFRNIPLSHWIEREHTLGEGRPVAPGAHLPMSSIRAAISSRKEP